MITLKSIAKELNMSYTTVSRALSNDPKIKLETRELVQKRAKELNYVPNSIAKGLVTKKTNTIGLIVPDITEPFIGELAKALSIEAKKMGMTLYLCNTNWDYDASKIYFETLIARQVDGILVLPTSKEGEFLTSNVYRNIKIVLVGSNIKNSEIKIFQCDNIKGIQLGMEELIKKGKKKIAYIGAKTDLMVNDERFLAYKNFLMDKGMEYQEKRVVISDRGEDTLNGYLSMTKLYEQTTEIDGIICFNDSVALGVLRKLNELRINVPEDIAVVGFDDISFSKLVGVELTTIRQPISHMARDCINYFKGNSNDINNYSLYIPELIVRKTT